MKKFILISLALFCFVSLFANNTNPSYSNQFLIRFELGTPIDSIINLKQAYGATEIGISPLSKVRLWEIQCFSTPSCPGTPNGIGSINGVIADAQSRAKVNSVGLNYIIFLPDSPGSKETNFSAPCPSNFSLSCRTGNNMVKVSVLDSGIAHSSREQSGIQLEHPTLFNPYFDINNLGFNLINNHLAPYDLNGHGTSKAGIIAYLNDQANNPYLILESYKTHNNVGLGNCFDIIEGIDEAILNDVHIMNMSFSYRAPHRTQDGKPEPMEVAINIAKDYDLLVVAAAGNDGPYNNDNDNPSLANFPASFSCDNIISVASVSCSGILSSFSNMGNQTVDIAAPGEDIHSPGLSTNLGLISSGTSDATAIVSGVAAELATHLQNPTWDILKCAILNGAEFKSNLQGLVLTEGIINAQSALDALNKICLEDQSRNRGIEKEAINSSESIMKVYPIPFEETFFVEIALDQSSKLNIQIFDSVGKLIVNKKEEGLIGKNTYSLPMGDNDNSSIFFIKIVHGQEVYSQKIMKF